MIIHNSQYRKLSSRAGFSVVEMLVAVFIGMIVVEAAYLFFPLGSRITREGEAQNEIIQDTRITLNRIQRELRQTPTIIDTIPSGEQNAINSVAMENGFLEDEDPEPSYVRYSKNGDSIYRQKYHFEDGQVPANIVHYDDPDAIEVEDSNDIFTANVAEFKLYMQNGVIKIYLTLHKAEAEITLFSSVYPRNAE